MWAFAYPWVKAAHLIFVIFWMAGLFMYPRFLVYHQEALNTPEAAVWIDREAKLRTVILTPAMIIVWMLGIVLAINTGAFREPWLHAKLVLVLGLTGYHGWMIGYARKLAGGTARYSGKTLRLINEIPGVAVTLIVILVVVQPF